MARGNSGAGGVLVLAIAVIAGSFLLKLAWTVFVAILILSPVVLVGAWLIAFLNVLARTAPPGRNAFGFTAEEHVDVERRYALLTQLEGQEHAALVQGGNLAKRNDGYFQERSDLARTLNAKIQALRPQIAKARADLQVIQVKPDLRKGHYVRGVARFRVLSTAMVLAIVTMNALMYMRPELFVVIGTAMDDFAKVTSLPALLLGAAACGAVVGWAFYAVRIAARIEIESERIGKLPNVTEAVVQRYAATL